MSDIRGFRAVLRHALFAAGALALFVGTAAAQPLALDKAAILAAHNKVRAGLGLPPLSWSDKLAQGALNWAKVIAGLNVMRHSGTGGVGENLAIWSGAGASLNGLIDMWIRERAYYHPGTFPAVSSTGDWESVAHYTQMVWRNTTEVGCGIANNGVTDYLVCWYNPQGNYIGQVPY
ncbi:MAG TPA: CAP domain-containing protein [Rhizomicrobium sp.]